MERADLEPQSLKQAEKNILALIIFEMNYSMFTLFYVMFLPGTFEEKKNRQKIPTDPKRQQVSNKKHIQRVVKNVTNANLKPTLISYRQKMP